MKKKNKKKTRKTQKTNFNKLTRPTVRFMRQVPSDFNLTGTVNRG